MSLNIKEENQNHSSEDPSLTYLFDEANELHSTSVIGKEFAEKSEENEDFCFETQFAPENITDRLRNPNPIKVEMEVITNANSFSDKTPN